MLQKLKVQKGNATITMDYGQCIVCPKSCAPGKCIGRRGDQCTKCWKGALLAPNVGKTYGRCIRCANNCKYRKCVGTRSDQCTECNFPRTLVKNKWPDRGLRAEMFANQTVLSGTCIKCASTCTEAKCVGERGDECTACPADRTLVLNPSPTGNGTADNGMCISCATNCLPGKCAGIHSYQCTACASNKVLIKAKTGPHADKPYGSCIQCAYTCKPRECVGEKTWQCKACPVGRTLVRADKDKTYGYCAANSVVKNTQLNKQLAAQAEEINILKEAAFDTKDRKLNEVDQSDDQEISAMTKESKEISAEADDVQNMAEATMFSATTSAQVARTELGEAASTNDALSAPANHDVTEVQALQP